jgi:hypothetical protein
MLCYLFENAERVLMNYDVFLFDLAVQVDNSGRPCGGERNRKHE